MAKSIYRLFDQKANLYLQTFSCTNDEAAIRDFRSAVNSDTPGNVSRYPEDFMLMHVGEDDEETGKITGVPERAVINGMHLIEEMPLQPNKVGFEPSNGVAWTVPARGQSQEEFRAELATKDTTPTNSGSK